MHRADGVSLCRIKSAAFVAALFFIKTLHSTVSSQKALPARFVAALITSRLDYWKSVLAGLPAEQIGRLHRVQNSAAQLAVKKSRLKLDYVTPQLSELHWLPVKFRCEYKMTSFAYRHFNSIHYSTVILY